MKIMDFHQFGDSYWSRRLYTGHKNLKSVENSFQTFSNASETHVSEWEKLPDHLGWPTRSDRVSQFHEIIENLEIP